MKIEGRTFIISGGVSGLGLATARALHSLGGYVSLLDLNSDNGNAVVSELGQRSRFFETDVTSSDAIAAAIAGTVAWIKETNAIVSATEGVVSMDGEIIKCKLYPKPALFVLRRG